MNKPLFLKLSFLLITLVLVFSCKEKTKYESINQNENGFISSKEIPDSYFLGDNNCKECHQQEFKDWKGGAHGKQLGGWAPPRVSNTCVNCHNPHNPYFEKRWPVRFNTQKVKERQ